MEGSNPPAANQQPTMEEIKAIADKASQDALEAKSIAEAKQNVQTSVETEAKNQGIELSEEDAKKIANALVTQLDSMGMLENAEDSNHEPATPPTNAAPAADNSAQPANAEPLTAPAPPAADTSPAKKTWAERFMGR